MSSVAAPHLNSHGMKASQGVIVPPVVGDRVFFPDVGRSGGSGWAGQAVAPLPIPAGPFELTWRIPNAGTNHFGGVVKTAEREAAASITDPARTDVGHNAVFVEWRRAQTATMRIYEYANIQGTLTGNANNRTLQLHRDAAGVYTFYIMDAVKFPDIPIISNDEVYVIVGLANNGRFITDIQLNGRGDEWDPNYQRVPGSVYDDLNHHTVYQTLTKSTGGTAWESGALSISRIRANTPGDIAFTLQDVAGWQVGLHPVSDRGSLLSPTLSDELGGLASFYHTSPGNMQLQSYATNLKTLSGVSAGEVLRITRNAAGDILFSRDGLEETYGTYINTQAELVLYQLMTDASVQLTDLTMDSVGGIWNPIYSRDVDYVYP